MNNDTPADAITQVEKDAAALNPCPWCGATCIVVTADNQDFAAACGFCRCFGPRNVSRTEAMAAWNHRTPSPAAQDGLVDALRKARRIIQEIDEYQSEPERGGYGVECACCMGELLDDDRQAIAQIDAALASIEVKS